MASIDIGGARPDPKLVTADDTVANTPSLARAIVRAPLLLARHLWVWPLVGALTIGVAGYWVRSRVEETTRADLASRLQTVLAADISALYLWFNEQEYNAQSFAADLRIQEAIRQLAAMARDRDVDPSLLASSSPAATLELYLKPLLENQHYQDYVVVSADHRIVASSHPSQVGRMPPRTYDLFLRRALGGQPSVSRPFPRETAGSPRGAPTMFVGAPVKATNGAVVAALGLRMKPEDEFSRIFSVARMGETGDSYAFDGRGVVLSALRFDKELKELGLITNSLEATSILNLRLADPGEELQPGQPLSRRRGAMPLTRMAASATQGYRDYDVQGYRNYRGVKVVGAWTWLPRYGMGVATEVSLDEAFQTLYDLRRLFLVLFVLLVLSGAAILVFTLLVEHLQAAARREALTAKRLGQYVLMQEIGRGASGMVYRARHALLRRPVAVKLLSPELTNDDNIARFEHEVQITSQLTHPNTVAIYDYGRTPEGLFYYAMEYLSGIELDQLVRRFGPQPEGRVIFILRQVCGSLAEAHRIGLIHRDIKPANVVLTRRGGVCDVVKVLDFGLVKARHLRPTDAAMANAVVGTPHFMPPEAIEKPDSVDARSDLYSVAAVGYWLLTGQTLFDGHEVEGLLAQQVKGQPLRLSERLGRAVSADLEALLMQCLAKTPAERPASSEALDEALGRCTAANTWGAAEAEKWWQAHMAGFETAPVAAMAEKTLVIAPRA
ncbi:Serine/threonine kinase [Verrucomicrobia bacterium]|nr:Serine/threonine kinase [Verrucomicrobiota bacterium]